MADSRRALEIVLEFKDKLTGPIKTATQLIAKFGGAVRSSFAFAARQVFSLRGALVGLIGGAVAGGIGAAVKSVANLGDELLALSQKTGLSVETLSRLKFAAEQSNTSIESLAQALVKFQVNTGEFARTGGGEAADAIALLGSEFEDAARAGAPAAELLDMLISRFEGLETQSDKLTVAVKLFGRGGSELLPLLSEGEKGLAALMRQSEALGKVWSEDDAKAADNFGDAIGRLKAALGGTLESAIKPLLPVFTDLLDKATEFVREHQAPILAFFENLLRVADALVPVIRDTFSWVARLVGLGDWQSQISGVDTDIRGNVLELQRLNQLRAGADPSSLRDIDDLRAGNERALAENLRKRERLVRIQELSAQFEGIGQGDGPGGLAAAADALARAREGLGAGPSGRSSIFGSSGSGGNEKPGGLAGFKEALFEIRKAGTDTFTQLKTGTLQATEAITDGLAGGIAKATQNWRNFGEVARQTGQQILQSLQQIITKLTLMRIIGGALDYFGIGEKAPVSTPTNARGTPYTRGGEIAGEAGPEAIIPLPGNRHVPVQLMGGVGGGGQTVIIINANDAKSFDEQLRAGAARQRRFLGGLQAAQFGRSPALRSKYA